MSIENSQNNSLDDQDIRVKPLPEFEAKYNFKLQHELIKIQSSLNDSSIEVQDTFPILKFEEDECYIELNKINEAIQYLFNQFYNLSRSQTPWLLKGKSFFLTKPYLPNGNRVFGITGLHLALQAFSQDISLENFYFNTASQWKAIERNFDQKNELITISWSGFYSKHFEWFEYEDAHYDGEDKLVFGFTKILLSLYMGSYSLDNVSLECWQSPQFSNYLSCKFGENTSDYLFLKHLLQLFEDSENVKNFVERHPNLAPSLSYILLVVATWDFKLSYESFEHVVKEKGKTFDFADPQNFFYSLNISTCFIFNFRKNYLEEPSSNSEIEYQTPSEHLNLLIAKQNFASQSLKTQEESFSSILDRANKELSLSKENIEKLKPTSPFKITSDIGVFQSTYSKDSKEIIAEIEKLPKFKEEVLSNLSSISYYPNNLPILRKHIILDTIQFYWNFYLYAFLGEDKLSKKPVGSDWSVYQTLFFFFSKETDDYVFELDYLDLVIKYAKREAFNLFTRTVLMSDKSESMSIKGDGGLSSIKMYISPKIISMLKTCIVYPSLSFEEEVALKKNNETQQSIFLKKREYENCLTILQSLDGLITKFLSSDLLQKEKLISNEDDYAKSTIVFDWYCLNYFSHYLLQTNDSNKLIDLFSFDQAIYESKSHKSQQISIADEILNFSRINFNPYDLLKLN